MSSIAILATILFLIMTNELVLLFHKKTTKLVFQYGPKKHKIVKKMFKVVKQSLKLIITNVYL